MPFLLQLVCLSAAAGGALAALVLGHWYLVTPRISITPLVLLTRVLAGVVALQLALFAIWALFGGGPGQGPFDSLTGSAALYGWLRLVVSLIFPLVLAIMAWRTVAHTLDGVGNRLALHRHRGDCGGHDRSGGAVRDAGRAGLTISVRLFAMLRERAGWRLRSFDVAAGTTVDQAWQVVAGTAPALAAYRSRRPLRAQRRSTPTPADVLNEGDELALIPPVAGGAESAPASSSSREAPLTDDLVAELRREVPTTADGAVVIFVGQTRETPGTPAPGEEAEAARFAGQTVTGLEYEAFDEMALAVLHDIAAEIEAALWREPAGDHPPHRRGWRSGEASVVIAVAAAHRGAAFDAAATPSRSSRPAHRSGSASNSPMVRSGSAPRRARPPRQRERPKRRAADGSGLLSVDMEGVAGISHIKPTTRGDVGYDEAAELMLGEANAAIEGAFEGGATDVTRQRQPRLHVQPATRG